MQTLKMSRREFLKKKIMKGFLLFGIVLCLFGCNKERSISGTVTFNDQPDSGAVVMIIKDGLMYDQDILPLYEYNIVYSSPELINLKANTERYRLDSINNNVIDLQQTRTLLTSLWSTLMNDSLKYRTFYDFFVLDEATSERLDYIKTNKYTEIAIVDGEGVYSAKLPSGGKYHVVVVSKKKKGSEIADRVGMFKVSTVVVDGSEDYSVKF